MAEPAGRPTVVGRRAIIALPAQRGFREDLRAEQDRLLERLAGGTADTGLATYWSGMVQAWTDRWVWLGLVPVLAALAYHLVMLRTFSATVGKRSLGRVLTQFGPGRIILPLGFATGSATVIALLVVCAIAWQLLDHLWAAGNGRRALHDLVAGTRVVRAT